MLGICPYQYPLTTALSLGIILIKKCNIFSITTVDRLFPVVFMYYLFN